MLISRAGYSTIQSILKQYELSNILRSLKTRTCIWELLYISCKPIGGVCWLRTFLSEPLTPAVSTMFNFFVLLQRTFYKYTLSVNKIVHVSFCMTNFANGVNICGENCCWNFVMRIDWELQASVPSVHAPWTSHHQYLKFFRRIYLFLRSSPNMFWLHQTMYIRYRRTCVNIITV